jgi:hypothetical protein
MTDPPASGEFVSEPIDPLPGTFDTTAMARGEAGLPREFDWRGIRHTVLRVLSTWKSSTPDRGEMYLRRHWFEVETTSGTRMTLYCERQVSRPKKAKSRWFLYTLNALNPRS